MTFPFINKNERESNYWAPGTCVCKFLYSVSDGPVSHRDAEGAAALINRFRHAALAVIHRRGFTNCATNGITKMKSKRHLRVHIIINDDKYVINDPFILKIELKLYL